MIFADLVKQITNTTGTGSLTLSSTPTGFRSFSVVGIGNTCYYAIQDANGAWEIGIGTVGDGTLERTTVLASSNSNFLVDLAAGSKYVSLTAPAQFLQGLAGNDFGNGSDGDVTVSTDTALATTTGVDDTGYVLKQYNSLTIDAGCTLTATNRAQIMVIKVRGNCTINGHLHMDKKGAAGQPSGDISFPVSPPQGLPYTVASGGKISRSVPAVGASGGAQSSTTGNAGSAGAAGQTGGGGSGAGNTYGSKGGAGAAGTCFCGGSGGGGGSYNWSTSQGVTGSAGAAYGGQGGNAGAFTGSVNECQSAGGGAGNPVGTGSTYNGSGTATVVASTGGGGGTLILLVGGNLTIGSTGSITADGGQGGCATSVNGSVNRAHGGGGAGGGSIMVFYVGSYANSGSIHASGGLGGTATAANTANPGGAGGAGSVQGPIKVGG